MSTSSRPEINAGSMADIAFLLLIFFLVTTTMDTDKGIVVVLPPPLDPNIPPVFRNDRNVLEVLINAQDYLLVEGEPTSIESLTEVTRKFITNNGKDPSMSDNPQEAIVSLKNDRSTSYSIYIKVQNELKRAYNEIRKKEANSRFGKNFEDLSKEEQSQIRKTYPLKISEAEAMDVNG